MHGLRRTDRDLVVERKIKTQNNSSNVLETF